MGRGLGVLASVQALPVCFLKVSVPARCLVEGAGQQRGAAEVSVG